MKNLNGLSVMVTRPAPQGEILCAQIRAAGGRPIYFPTIEIRPPQDLMALTHGIATLDQYDWVIFVSPQAVYQSMHIIREYWPQFPRDVRVAALGGGTAEALRQAHLPVDAYPAEDWRSEGLLDDVSFQALAGKKVALICGESGREFLAETLTVRGAHLTNIVAYRRCLPQAEVSEPIGLVRAHNIDIILCTSGEILHNLKILLKAVWADLRSIPVVVVSERLQMLAKQLEFEKILLAKNASHEAMMLILKDYICQMKEKMKS
ncbi:MAG: hemD [Gammaproteobacteria bacterium]|jgi:uroporphyrinogen-III synthase|nr:hemD [Gammaproteobacteria bacterium]